MLKKIKFVFLLISIFSCTSSKKKQIELKSNNQLSSEIQKTCTELKTSKGKVYIFKQWHLSPGAKSLEKSYNEFPHWENLYYIYKDLDHLISSQKTNTLWAEGCEGKLNKNFKTEFNGWTYDSLKALYKKSEDRFEKVPTHVPLKIEVKYGDKINTYCAEKESLIKDSLLSVSDLRAFVGFFTRIHQFKDNLEKSFSYIEALKNLEPETKDLNNHEVMIWLKDRISRQIVNIENNLKIRNNFIVKKISENLKKSKNKVSALVIGGLHTDDIVEKLSNLGIGCEVRFTKGYDIGSEAVFKNLKNLFKE